MHDKLQSALRMQQHFAKLDPTSGANQAPMVMNGRKVKNLQYCHELVRDTAKALAGDVYEAAMMDNDNYATWKLLCNDLDDKFMQAEWIKLMWPRMIDDARATLAQLLGTSKNELLKEQIHRALILDGELRRSGRGPKPLFRR